VVRAARHVGTAGWSIPAVHSSDFPSEGSHLERYASRLGAVEINSSFSRSHRRATYAKWAGTVGPTFRFSVKVPKAITHDNGLVGTDELLKNFAEEISGLGNKLDVVLVQLPPKLVFDADSARTFFDQAHKILPAAIAVEPRHPSWFNRDTNAFLEKVRVARVAAHPVLHGNGEPGGWDGLTYYRLHGAPKTYYSNYDEEALYRIAERLNQAPPVTSWCIFDNTAAGAATGNALSITGALKAAAGEVWEWGRSV
jgi:uncharacterized protein YecE (DUF72 family)